MTSDRRKRMVDSLRDSEYRDMYVESQITEALALQIRLLRESHPWTQAQLGQRAGTSQVVISRLEDPDYGNFTLKTLRRLALAFDVALIVRFAPFSELVDWTLTSSPGKLCPPDFEHDPGLYPQSDDNAVMRRLLAERSVPHGTAAAPLRPPNIVDFTVTAPGTTVATLPSQRGDTTYAAR